MADTAADGQRQLALQQHFVEGQLAALLAAALFQLVAHGDLVHTDAHGGDLKATLQHVVPHKDIAVEGPIVIVRGAAVVGLAGALEVVADLHEEHGMVLLTNGVLPLSGGLIGPAVLQLLGGDEIDLPVQLGVQAGESDLQGVIGLAYGAHDSANGLAQVVLVAVLPGDDLLPVPLIHIDGVGVIHFLIAADGIHVGEQALAHIELVFLQRQALPLSQRMDYLGVRTNIGDVEGDGALDTVEVIV